MIRMELRFLIDEVKNFIKYKKLRRELVAIKNLLLKIEDEKDNEFAMILIRLLDVRNQVLASDVSNIRVSGSRIRLIDRNRIRNLCIRSGYLEDKIYKAKVRISLRNTVTA